MAKSIAMGLATAAVVSVSGPVVLPLLGFGAVGIASGSIASAWMATFAGATPAAATGALLPVLQAAGMTGAAMPGVITAASGIIGALGTLIGKDDNDDDDDDDDEDEDESDMVNI